MRPQEKAEELVDKMLYCFQGHIDQYTAKQCALVAVDEILSAIGFSVMDEYWQEVKQEIEKL
jgi:hypothetical protein